MAASAEVAQREKRGVSLEQMRDAQRTAQNAAPAHVVEVRLIDGEGRQRERLGIGSGALPLKREIAVNALAPTIGAITDESAVASGATALSARSAEAAATTTESTTATTSAESTAAWSAKASSPRTRSSWSARHGLSVRAKSGLGAGSSLDAQHRTPQAEVILTGLQPVANRPIHQKCFIGVCRGRRGCILRAGGGNLVQLVFRIRGSRTEAAWLALRTLRKLARASLQLERPLHSRRCCAGLHLFAGSLEAKHLHFHRVSSWREIGEFIRAGFVRCSGDSMTVLRSDHRGAGHGLIAELHNSGGVDA